MKYVLGYWIIGCMIGGLVAKKATDYCPNEGWPQATEVAAFVAIWPVPVFASLFGKKSKELCSDGTAFRVSALN